MPPPTPPFDADAEKAVLGAILLRPSVVDRCIEEGLRAEDFWVPENGWTFAAMLRLADSGRPTDAVSVQGELANSITAKASAAGRNAVYLAELQAFVPTAENVAYYARVVVEKSLLRSLIAEASGVAASAYGARDAAACVEESERRIFALTQRSSRSRVRASGEVVREAMAALDARSRSPEHVVGVPSGFADLDRITGGFQPGEFVIVAARPSVGKTSFALNAAAHAAAELALPVLFFSVEMSAQAVGERLVCSAARVDSLRARGGRLDSEEWSRVVGVGTKLQRARLWVDDGGSPAIGEIRAKARRWRSDRAIFPSGGLGLVVVDYLQLVRPGEGLSSREQEVSAVSRGLKALAKELDLPVVALAQLNRSVEDRVGQRPRLSDLRESGALEQDADVVIFMSRSDREPGGSHAVAVDVAKNRNGPIGTAELVFLAAHTRFESSAREGWGT